MAEGYYLTQQDRDLLDTKIAEINATLRRLDNFTAGGAAGFLNTANAIAIDYKTGDGGRRRRSAQLIILNSSGEDKKQYQVLGVKSVQGAPTVTPLQQSGGASLTPADVPADYPHATPALEGENPTIEDAYGQPTGYREGRMVVLLEDTLNTKSGRCIGDGYALVQIWAAGDLSSGQMKWAALVEPSYFPTDSGSGSASENTEAAKYLVAVDADWGSGVQVVWAESYSNGEKARLIWALLRFSAPNVARMPVYATYELGEMKVYRAVLGPGETDALVQSTHTIDAPHELGWEFYEPGFYWAYMQSGRWLVPGRPLRVGTVTAGDGPTYTVQQGLYSQGSYVTIGTPVSGVLNTYEDVDDIDSLKPDAPDSATLTKMPVRGRVMLERLGDDIVFWAPVLWATECSE